MGVGNPTQKLLSPQAKKRQKNAGKVPRTDPWEEQIREYKNNAFAQKNHIKK